MIFFFYFSTSAKLITFFAIIQFSIFTAFLLRLKKNITIHMNPGG